VGAVALCRRFGVGMAVGAVDQAAGRPAGYETPGWHVLVATCRHDGMKACVVGVEFLGHVLAVGHIVAAIPTVGEVGGQ
jgi:hypothetical protein